MRPFFWASCLLFHYGSVLSVFFPISSGLGGAGPGEVGHGGGVGGDEGEEDDREGDERDAADGEW